MYESVMKMAYGGGSSGSENNGNVVMKESVSISEAINKQWLMASASIGCENSSNIS
jgi:hypothetical protein